MKMPVLKSIFGGAFIGALIFFTGPLLLIVFLLKFIFTPFGMGRMMYMRGGYGNMGMPPFAFADKIRGMNDEEFSQFKERMQYRQYGGCGWNHHHNYNNNNNQSEKTSAQ